MVYIYAAFTFKLHSKIDEELAIKEAYKNYHFKNIYHIICLHIAVSVGEQVSMLRIGIEDVI